MVVTLFRTSGNPSRAESVVVSVSVKNYVADIISLLGTAQGKRPALFLSRVLCSFPSPFLPSLFSHLPLSPTPDSSLSALSLSFNCHSFTLTSQHISIKSTTSRNYLVAKRIKSKLHPQPLSKLSPKPSTASSTQCLPNVRTWLLLSSRCLPSA